MTYGYLAALSVLDDPLMMMNSRYSDGIMSAMDLGYHNYEASSVAHFDQDTIKETARTLAQYREPFFGWRFLYKDRVDKILQVRNETDAHKLAAVNNEYCKENGGGDPIDLIRDIRGFGIWASGRHNERLEQLAKAAVIGRNPDLAAALIKSAGDGIKINHKLVRAILIDSKEHMGSASHARFITETSNAFKQMTGESMADFVAAQSSSALRPAGLGALGLTAAAFIVGLMTGGGLPLLAVAAIAGGIGGFTLGDNGWLGTSAEGEEYLKVIDATRNNTHNVGSGISI